MTEAGEPTCWRDATNDVPLTLSDDEATFKPDVAPIRLLFLFFLKFVVIYVSFILCCTTLFSFLEENLHHLLMSLQSITVSKICFLFLSDFIF